MVTLYDKYSKVEYKSVGEITADIIKGKKNFIVEIPNSNIKGLDLEFRIVDDGHIIFESEKSKPRKLVLRLVDGESYYIHYDGWYPLGDFNVTEITEKIIGLYKNLEEGKYSLELERTRARGVAGITGGCPPYYHIKFLSVDGKDLIKAHPSD